MDETFDEKIMELILEVLYQKLHMHGIQFPTLINMTTTTCICVQDMLW